MREGEEGEGELWVGGEGLALGYLGGEGEGGEGGFVWREVEEEQWEQGQPQRQRWFKTGDIVKRHKNGLLYFVGRKNHQKQVKIGGYRVEISGFFSLEFLSISILIH